MAAGKWWIICYDIHDEKRLRKCAKFMEGYGTRLQYSVFRCWLTPTEVQRIRWELTCMLLPEDDVLIIPLCSNCIDGITSIHGKERPQDWTDSPTRHIIL